MKTDSRFIPDAPFIEEALEKVRAAMPEDLDRWKRSTEDKVKMSLEGVFKRMDLVTREEYEVQVEVLNRMRTKIKELEQRIEALEKNQT